MTVSPRLPSSSACDPDGSGPGSAELRRMTELALRRGARSVAVGGGPSPSAGGGSWTVCNGTIQAAPAQEDSAT